jgi:hypothetical protein
MQGCRTTLRVPPVVYAQKGHPVTLVEFAKQLPEDFTEQQFVDLMNTVIDLKSVITLSERERSILFSAVQYLADYVLLAQEAMDEVEISDGQPVLTYDGPYIPSILQRPEEAEADFAALENFGVGEAERHFGADED